MTTVVLTALTLATVTESDQLLAVMGDGLAHKIKKSDIVCSEVGGNGYCSLLHMGKILWVKPPKQRAKK